MTLEFAGVKAKPCPFCGGEELEFHESYSYTRIQCRNIDCQAIGPADLGKSGAIDKWNAAAARAEKAEAKVKRVEAILKYLRPAPPEPGCTCLFCDLQNALKEEKNG